MSTLLASTATLESMKKLVKEYFYSSSIELHEEETGTIWSVYNSKGVLSNFLVIKQKKRYRFERN
jgi:hypothetical protein